MGNIFSPNRASIFLLTTASCALTTFSTLHAAPTPTPAAKDTPAASTAAALDATNADALRPHVNEEIEVQGTPSNTGQSKAATVFYLNFGAPHRGVAIVFFAKSSANFGITSVDDLKQYLGKTVTVSGKLTDYKGDLQIVVNGIDQIKATP